jgi:class 3 adenylate cyclase
VNFNIELSLISPVSVQANAHDSCGCTIDCSHIADLSGTKQQRQTFRLLPPRKVHAIMFGDFHGFSRLNDRQMLTFYDHVMDRVASILDKYASDIVARNTWGDGLFLVFSDLDSAARCALELQSEWPIWITVHSDYPQASACDWD